MGSRQHRDQPRRNVCLLTAHRHKPDNVHILQKGNYPDNTDTTVTGWGLSPIYKINKSLQVKNFKKNNLYCTYSLVLLEEEKHKQLKISVVSIPVETHFLLAGPAT